MFEYLGNLYWSIPWQAQWLAETHQFGMMFRDLQLTRPMSQVCAKSCRSCAADDTQRSNLYNNAREAESWNTTDSKFHVYTD